MTLAHRIPIFSEQVNTQSSILVGCADRCVWIRVEGKGSFLNSSGVKEFAKEMVNRGHREFVVDLRNCPAMDSTFMGTMAGIALRLRELGEGHLHVVNLNERNSDLLCNLGLDQLFSLDFQPVAGNATVPLEAGAEATDRQAQMSTMIEAHEALVDADAANLTKFKDVLEYLKQDLHHSE